jgi:hypothetical protein
MNWTKVRVVKPVLALFFFESQDERLPLFTKLRPK